MKLLRLYIIIFLLFFSSAVKSALLYYQPVQLIQPDGVILNLYASGDEFYNWVHDKYGFTIVKNPNNGFYVYATLEGQKLIPSNLIAGKSNPYFAGIKPWLIDSKEIILEKSRKFFEMSPKDMGDAPAKGTINNLVVFIRFKNESEFTDSLAYYNRLFNNSISGNNSMYNYFKEVSYDSLFITSHFYPTTAGVFVISYQDTAHTRQYYQPYDSVSNPIGYKGGDNGTERTLREHALLRNAVNYVASMVPAGLNIDGDSDGKVDNTCFIIDGSAGSWASLLWPHRWALYSYSAYINGKLVYDYNFQLQNSLKSSGVGVLCHEMFHSLGAPDLYHYSYDGLQPVYRWDIMENNLNPPQHMCAYMKWKYGKWISTIPVVSEGTYTLNPLTSKTNNCYRINSPYSSTEYFVVEYRKRIAPFESGLPGDGLLVFRINSSYNGNANGPPDEVYVYRPNGTTTVNGSPSLANYSSGSGRTSIDSTTNPTPFLTNGSQGGLRINNITSASSTISFTLPSVSAPPNSATVFSPYNGKTNVYKPNLKIKWRPNGIPNPTGFKLYLGTDNPPTNLINGQNLGYDTSYTPSSLSYSTTYYWKIVPYNSYGDASNCPVWSFTTQSNASYGGGQVSNGYYYFANSTPDANGSPSQPVYEWLNFTSNEVLVWSSGNGDDGYFRINDIQFNFNFFGNFYKTNNIFICTNGYVSFGTGYTAYQFVQLPNTSTPNNIIAGAWRDLDCRTTTYSDAHVYYGGDAEKFVVTFWHVHKFNDASTYITFQIILFSNGGIKIQYNDAETSTPLTNMITNGCSAGIENSTGGYGLSYRYAVDDTTITGGPIFSSPVAVQFGTEVGTLPIELASFTSSVSKRNVILNWITSFEQNNAGFAIERKNYNEQYKEEWVNIGYVSGKNQNIQNNYNYTDKNLNSGKYNYRLKQFDFNGNFTIYYLENTVEIALPETFYISQNYPNPFNPSTNIDFEVPYKSHIKITIYDIAGKIVKILTNNVYQSGFYSLSFNAAGMASGIYFYIIEANNGKDYRAVRKMAYIR